MARPEPARHGADRRRRLAGAQQSGVRGAGRRGAGVAGRRRRRLRELFGWDARGPRPDLQPGAPPLVSEVLLPLADGGLRKLRATVRCTESRARTAPLSRRGRGSQPRGRARSGALAARRAGRHRRVSGWRPSTNRSAGSRAAPPPAGRCGGAFERRGGAAGHRPRHRRAGVAARLRAPAAGAARRRARRGALRGAPPRHRHALAADAGRARRAGVGRSARRRSSRSTSPSSNWRARAPTSCCASWRRFSTAAPPASHTCAATASCAATGASSACSASTARCRAGAPLAALRGGASARRRTDAKRRCARWTTRRCSRPSSMSMVRRRRPGRRVVFAVGAAQLHARWRRDRGRRRC